VIKLVGGGIPAASLADAATLAAVDGSELGDEPGVVHPASNPAATAIVKNEDLVNFTAGLLHNAGARFRASNSSARSASRLVRIRAHAPSAMWALIPRYGNDRKALALAV
jgi:hypothetical protein